MAIKDKKDNQDFPAPPPGSGFTNVPMPSQDVVDQLAATVQQVEPEALLGGAQFERPVYDPLAVALRGNYSNKPISQLVDEFMAAVAAHPDGKLLNCAIGGTPTDQQKFPDTALRDQHRVEIRLVYRDVPLQVAQPGGTKKPWKWQALIDAQANEPVGGRAAEMLAKKSRETVPA